MRPRDPALPPARRVAAVRRRLAEVYGVPVQPPHGDPLGELVLTVLSQSTNDRNRDVAYLRLVDRLPTWQAVRVAPVAEVRAAIEPGGLHVQKSARILAILDVVAERSPDLDLRWLADVPLREAQAWLCSLPGVGRKTAACVLLFAFGVQDVPVDTHVGRVTARLGWLPERGTSDRLHDLMLGLTPRGAALELHVNLLRHGRRTCHARRPACRTCALQRMCPSRMLSS